MQRGWQMSPPVPAFMWVTALPVISMGRSVPGMVCPFRSDMTFEHGESDEGAIPDAVIDNMTELLDILRANREL